MNSNADIATDFYIALVVHIVVQTKWEIRTRAGSAVCSRKYSTPVICLMKNREYNHMIVSNEKRVQMSVP